MDIKTALNSTILNEFITDEFLEEKMLLEVKKVFKNNFPKSVKLELFFKKDKYDLFKREILKLKFKKYYLADEHSYSKSLEIGKEFKRLLESNEFKTYLMFLFDKKDLNFKNEVKCFEHKDYTLMNDEENISFIEINFFFSTFMQEFGGYFSYMKENNELLRVVPSENSLTLVHLQKGVKEFVKYVNVKSKDKKVYFINLAIR